MPDGKRRILVPVDGSEESVRALRHALESAGATPGSEVLVVTVEKPLPAAVTDFVPRANVESHYAEEAEKALAPARKALEGTSVPHKVRWLVGSPPEAIVGHCRDQGCTEIVMGCRGLGRLSGLLLGSVTTKVLSLAAVPITLVK